MMIMGTYLSICTPPTVIDSISTKPQNQTTNRFALLQSIKFWFLFWSTSIMHGLCCSLKIWLVRGEEKYVLNKKELHIVNIHTCMQPTCKTKKKTYC